MLWIRSGVFCNFVTLPEIEYLEFVRYFGETRLMQSCSVRSDDKHAVVWVCIAS